MHVLAIGARSAGSGDVNRAEGRGFVCGVAFESPRLLAVEMGQARRVSPQQVQL